jgi:hypothetical protein
MAGPGVFRHEYTVPCGFEYGEVGPGAFLVCACRTVAIGLCAECGKAVCGFHSELCAGRRLCEADNPRLRAEAQRVEAARRRQGAAATAWAEWSERLKGELGDVYPVGDVHPIERLVRVMTLLSEDEIKSRELARQRELMSALKGVLRSLWSTDLMKRPPWDHERVLEWFLGAVKTPPAPQQILAPRGAPVIGQLKPKLVTVPGWTFTSGSTNHILADDWHYPMTVLVDGRRGSYLDRPESAPDKSGFSGLALREMAKLAHLPSLTPPPAR